MTNRKSFGGNVKSESTDNIDAYYKDSKICIYNYEQLKQIGSDAYIYTGDKEGQIGSGEVVKSEGTELKYGADKNEKIITGLKRISKPGLRVYADKENLPKVLGGLGVAILSTNQGVITDKQARELGVGGEVLAFVW